MRIITKPIKKSELATVAQEGFGDMVKAVVDLEKEVMAIGGELHADEEAVLLEKGSQQKYLWGINIYPTQNEDNWIEFDSVINIRPMQDNRSRGVESLELQKKIKQVVKKLIK